MIWMKRFLVNILHTWATEFPRVWVRVRVGYPQPTIYPTTDFLKHLILSYSFEIKLNTCRNNRNFISIYFKAGCRVYCRLDTVSYQDDTIRKHNLSIWLFFNTENYATNLFCLILNVYFYRSCEDCLPFNWK